jgi:hypothetical protein
MLQFVYINIPVLQHHTNFFFFFFNIRNVKTILNKQQNVKKYHDISIDTAAPTSV